MTDDRLGQSEVEKRLSELPSLEKALEAGWVAREFSKPFDQWSLIAGWLSKPENDPLYPYFAAWLVDLDGALALLQEKAEAPVWRKIRTKVRAHCDRAEIKGTLSEIAVALFCVQRELPIALERTLAGDNNKNVDVSVLYTHPVHIEIHYLSLSDREARATEQLSSYRLWYSTDFDQARYRIKLKIHDKTSKFTESDITFVAINCTECPDLGGAREHSTMHESALEAFTGRDLHGEVTPYADSDVDRSIRRLVDGVIWFELRTGNGLLPAARGACLNPNSPLLGKSSISDFVRHWMTKA
jgi:hypothetical protein